MIDQPFHNHREAALALLNGDQKFTRKAGQFLGQIAVDPQPMSERQLKWLLSLLDKADLPPLAQAGVA
jgi:hypothetical protein